MRVILLMPSFLFQAYFWQRRIVNRFEDPHQTCTQTVVVHVESAKTKAKLI